MLRNQEIIENTKSMCPICMEPIEAKIVAQDGAVYMKKVCPNHGPSTVYLWPDVDHFKWVNNFRMPFRSLKNIHNPSDHCPTSCGLCSMHLRHSTLVELEITTRCNLRCPVCFMSAAEAPPDPSINVLTTIFKNIYDKVGGQTSLQLTGGEPTVREDLAEVVRAAREVGFNGIEINTNGIVISKDFTYLQSLVDAGVTGIYMQFDGLTNNIYKKIRGGNFLENKLQAIENCRKAGIQVVLAMTIINGINEDQIGEVINFALDNLDVVVGVALQPAFTSGRYDVNAPKQLTMGDVAFLLSEQTNGMIDPYEMWPLSCSHPMCSSGTQLIRSNDQFIPVTRKISREEYMKAYNPNSPQGSIFADIIAEKEGYIGEGLSVLIMNYMDLMSMDLNRLRQCSMTVSTDDDRLIPFCAYHLTDMNGDRLYPEWIKYEETKVIG